MVSMPSSDFKDEVPRGQADVPSGARAWTLNRDPARAHPTARICTSEDAAEVSTPNPK
ncbi:protein of unknown function (plasmid) [Cupriavidus taiwanensis]|uniref:Uncharacterized protein n=1 Tax=Cupriavidus taiwanensis TaxID=164546 RepID=A0A375IUJ8_9BURK|nr:protein of unknown function [Cupriavidus taiwanensis]